MVLHESGEDYLEAILVLRQEKGIVRSIDVAQYLGYSKPSVSRAVSILKTNGYITMEKDGHLELTEEGEANAQRVYERHRFLTQWLVHLGVSPEPPRMPAALSTTSAPRPLSASSGTSAKTLRNKIRLTGARSGLSRRAPFNTHPKEEYSCPLTPFCPR